jgi:hypothetical protein
MDYVQHPFTMPSQILLSLLKADVAHLDQQMREINRLRAAWEAVATSEQSKSKAWIGEARRGGTRSLSVAADVGGFDLAAGTKGKVER